MESVFLTVDARRLTVRQTGQAARASGENCVRCYYTRLPRRQPAGQGGIVLQLDDYRPAPQAQPARSDRRRPSAPGLRAWLGLLLDAAATAAILALTVGALVCFAG